MTVNLFPDDFNQHPQLANKQLHHLAIDQPEEAMEDWEATCAIYEDAKTSSSLESRTCYIHLPLSIQNVFFARPLHHPAKKNKTGVSTYRFWTLEEPPIFCVHFTYDEDLQPCLVHVSLLSPYPPSWPTEEKVLWMKWIQDESSKILKEDQMSYSVCEFVEHQALHFFKIVSHQSTTALYSFVIFQDEGPKFYDTSTLVVSFTDAHDMSRFERHLSNGKSFPVTRSKLPKEEQDWISTLHAQRHHWIYQECPICFDTFSLHEMYKITCGHHFCQSCLPLFLSSKVGELGTYRTNPFLCPRMDCRRGMKVIGCVKHYLPPEEMDKVREWYKNLKHPPCWSLPFCPSKKCGAANTVRKQAVDSYVVTCERCLGTWCELCLRRTPMEGHGNEKEECKYKEMIAFCERYLTASDAARAKCEKAWPWIKVYAKSFMLDVSVLEWLKQERGQVCPICKTGVERTGGCFHMQCACGAHFCYECGEELFYPFYGTHHCWEQRGEDV